LANSIISHSYYDSLVHDLYNLIKKDKWTPDFIIAIAKGGLRMGDQLSRMFKKPLGIVSAHRLESLEIVLGESMTHLSGLDGIKNILVVDDLVDSGGTLGTVLGNLSRYFPFPLSSLSIKSGVLWRKENSSYKPDYVVAENIPSSVWIVQPFEVWEDKTFFSK
jgi:hypoxanthine phosphoribosyltransferase